MVFLGLKEETLSFSESFTGVGLRLGVKESGVDVTVLPSSC